MHGWFDLSRQRGEPAYFGDSKAPVAIDTQIFTWMGVFAIPSLAFLIILPGARKGKTNSAIAFLPLMFTGAAIMISQVHPSWHSAKGAIVAPYRTHSADLPKFRIKVCIGLRITNISLWTEPPFTQSNPKLKYNERFSIAAAHEIDTELLRAHRRGLPYPILKVLEHLTSTRDGFAWGSMYRSAGYYTSALLWFATALWSISLLSLFILPSHFGHLLLITGGLICLALENYFIFVPRELRLRFIGRQSGSSDLLEFKLGPAFYLVVAAAASCIVASCYILWSSRGDNEFATIFRGHDRREAMREDSVEWSIRDLGEGRDRFASARRRALDSRAVTTVQGIQAAFQQRSTDFLIGD